MGWLIVIAMPMVFRQFSFAALAWLVAGGVCYTAGVLFYRAEKLRGHHAVWHLFVIAGSVCHFFMMTAL
jgi:hemolysin III